MLSNSQISVVKATIPLLEDASDQLTTHFYQRMFKHNPELMNVFNMSNQRSGRQSVALFNALAAYARFIDDLPRLKSAVERIAQKHTSFDIRPQQYDIVGHHLIETLRELAGPAFTEEVESAWTAAYRQLAGVFIDREGGLYHERANAVGGWEGPRAFHLIEKRAESDLVTSFVFEPEDGGSVLDFKPGQYLGIRVQPLQHEFKAIRQYSISGRCNGKSYQISVKREGHDFPGVVSHYLHDILKVGDSVELFAPAGDFYFVDREAPVVLISAGVGITPMQAILEHLASVQYSHPVHYLHACEHASQHSFRNRVAVLQECLTFYAHTWYRNTESEETGTLRGLMDLAAVAQLPIAHGDFYLCGPVAFMQFIKTQLLNFGVEEHRIHYEVFGPHEAF
ncbi:flavohemoprotein [Oleiphilus messinensis]|uniref:Flavohemoprotein n=1 Tax=Oleiphilus messinensis TaxID=141451 RepID=A0A1Y0I2N9_9GAMM|nr:NO-inducible flavohemoprotein [Oleiphilus messinensis]ARU54737.1 flavohemoprotein [Oleiphilus messinensis]